MSASKAKKEVLQETRLAMLCIVTKKKTGVCSNLLGVSRPARRRARPHLGLSVRLHNSQKITHRIDKKNVLEKKTAIGTRIGTEIVTEIASAIRLVRKTVIVTIVVRVNLVLLKIGVLKKPKIALVTEVTKTAVKKRAVIETETVIEERAVIVTETETVRKIERVRIVSPAQIVLRKLPQILPQRLPQIVPRTLPLIVIKMKIFAMTLAPDRDRVVETKVVETEAVIKIN